jgi:hypothetical protein
LVLLLPIHPAVATHLPSISAKCWLLLLLSASDCGSTATWQQQQQKQEQT